MLLQSIQLIPTEMTDYSTSFGTLPVIVTFQPNEAYQTFSVWSIQDEITEGIECMYFSVEAIDEFVNITEENRTVTVCIEDDDSK